MSKIICDICGTSYSESSSQCPVCGCARPGEAQRVTNDVRGDKSGANGYTHVKGGRFSKTNVTKRNSSSKSASSGRRTAPRKNEKQEEKSGKGLLIVAILLFLAIIAVVIYLALPFFTSTENPVVTDPTETTSPTESGKSCTDITLDISTVTLTEAGEARLLWVTVAPSDTTDVVTYRSEDPSIATVNETGKIIAVSSGTTKIIVTCGDIVKECVVMCEFSVVTDPSEPSVEPTEPPTEPTEPELTIRLNRTDFSLFFAGEAWYLYTGTAPKDQVTFSSDDESVAKFVDGKVIAVGGGTTNVHAEYEGQKLSCIVRCNFKNDDGPVGGNGGVGEDGGDVTTTYAIYTYYGYQTTDFTIGVGKSESLYLSDGNGNTVEAVWEAGSDAITVEGNKVTGVIAGENTYVTATYEGKTYKCIVRVR